MSVPVILLIVALVLAVSAFAYSLYRYLGERDEW
jgi:hypothetical protein